MATPAGKFHKVGQGGLAEGRHRVETGEPHGRFQKVGLVGRS